MSAKNTVFGLKGNIVYSKTPMQLEICENGYLVCEEGKVKGVYPALPDTYAGIPVKDYGDRLLIPGLSDLHVHAPQYAFIFPNRETEITLFESGITSSS